MRAILDDALRTLAAPSASPLKHDVVAWMTADDVEWPFSFVNVCETLGMEPSVVRRFAVGLAATDAELPKGGCR